MVKAPKVVDYQSLSSELDAILLDLQSDSSDIDAALKGYARGLEIIKLLQQYLQTAEHTVTELQARQTTPSDTL